jgi:hypothetical protein
VSRIHLRKPSCDADTAHAPAGVTDVAPTEVKLQVVVRPVATPDEDLPFDSKVSGDGVHRSAAHRLTATALQHGVQARSAELDLADVLCELTIPLL